MGLAVLGCALLGALAVFQGLLIAGQPLGRFAWGGQHDVLPTKLRIGSAVSIVLYALFALIIVANAEQGSDGANTTDVGIWVLAAYFVVGVGMNAISPSRPERLVMTPVALVLAIVCLVLALA